MNMDWIIKNGNLFLSDKWGNTGRRISENVSFANFNESEKIFLVTLNDGKVVTKDINGNFLRQICDVSAIEARFQDDKILVRTRNGNELRDRVGNFLRKM
jgi:hypothetical protein